MTILGVVIYIILASYTIRTIRNSLYMVFLWQLKEYRIDRMLSHLQTPLGKRLISSPLVIIKTSLFAIILLLIPIIVNSSSAKLQGICFLIFGVSLVLFWLIWILEAIYYIKEFFKRGWFKPKFTVKTILILFILLSLQFPYLLFGNITFQLLGWGVILDRLLNPMLVIIIMLANFPSAIYKKWLVMKAKNKIRQLPEIKIIGITGSYGKTTTKEFLKQILPVKYKTFASRGSINTEIGISKAIVNDLKEKTEILIAEMGAYRKGEIRAMCTITPPSVGIITGINNQHVQLFGSMDNLLKTKFELIQNILPGGTAVFNAGNTYIRKMIEWTKNERPDLDLWGYGKWTDEKTEIIQNMQMVYAKDIQVLQDLISFTLIHKKEKIQCETKLFGGQNIENILACVCIALNLGMSLNQIKNAITALKPPPKTMNKIKGMNDSSFVNDTFNANPDGVIAALEYMKLYKGTKILILTPLIELGKEAERIHEGIGEMAARICDYLLLTNSNYYGSLSKGAQKTKGKYKLKLINTGSGVQFITDNIKKDDIVIFEGKEAEKILDRLLNI